MDTQGAAAVAPKGMQATFFRSETARNEAAVVAAAKNGDASAFEDLYQRHKGLIFRVALRVTGNREDAEDVLQQAFHKAFVHLGDFEGKSAFPTWLTRIAVNEALMLRRSDPRTREVSIDNSKVSDKGPSVMELPDTRPNQEHGYAQLEWKKILHTAFAALRPAIRLTLQIHGLDEQSLTQTAQILGVSVNTAKSRIYRGKKILHEKITQHVASANAL